MEWQVILALLIFIPVILFPAAIVWYINVSGLLMRFKLSLKKETLNHWRVG